MIEHMEISPDKCKACRRCEAACIAAHHDMSLKEAMKHKDALAPRVHVIKTENLKTSVRCHQCKDAPCCNVCPTQALQQDEDGRISMNQENCVGCEMCAKACPYGAISMESMRVQREEGEDGAISIVQSRKVATRCDMCSSWRMVNGKKITACMEACPVRALYMVEADGNVVEAPRPQKKPVGEKAGGAQA